jgi:hypothetical protein
MAIGELLQLLVPPLVGFVSYRSNMADWYK